MKLKCVVLTTLMQGFMVIAITFLSILTVFAQTGEESSTIQDQQHIENVERMLVLMGIPEHVSQTADGAMALYAAKVTDKEADRITEELVNAYQKDLSNIVNSVISWEAIKPNYINTYATNMTREDVENTLTFLESDVGKNFLSAQIQSNKQIKEITDHLVQVDMAPRLIELTKQLREGLTKVQTAKLNKKQ